MTTRKFAAFVLAAIILGQVPPVSAAPEPFKDMEWSWYRYKEAVDYLQKKNVLTGYSDGTFRPRQTINRAELLKIVFTGRSDTKPIARRCFSDVAPDDWFAPYVCAAKQRGIVDGYAGNVFKPGEPVNFAEAIKIVMNAYGMDVTPRPGPEWYVPYAAELNAKKILARSSYIPWEPLNRERAADLLWRVLRFQDDRFIANVSPGCGKAAVTAPSTITVNGLERQFLLTVPSGYAPHDPMPLIVAFHGRTNSNAQVRSYMDLDKEFRDTFIAYPSAIKKENGSYSWSDPNDKAGQLRDLTFFDEIVEVLANSYCIDMDRIYTVGHSLGAWMANSVACLRGGVVRASATVGGDSVMTNCAGPTAAMIAHNPKDNLASFAGAERVHELRTEENACSPKTTNTGPASLNCVRHSSCAYGSDILWCPHTINTDYKGAFYPHTWPDSTARVIVEFFESLPR